VIVYLDSSALVKLFVEEAESEPLRDALASAQNLASSLISKVEVSRAARAVGLPASAADETLATVSLIPIDDAVIEAAVVLDPETVRSLDAVHIASALSLGDQLGVLVTYDHRMRIAAEQRSIVTLGPR
jgi:predicted nucleic acid-binding protein